MYRSWWTDSYHCFDGDTAQRKGPEGTFNGWQLDKEPFPRIDFIYYQGDTVTPLCYCCNDSRYDGLFASDHFPVWVDFSIQ